METSTDQRTLPANYRRNFWCLAMDFGFFGVGMAFFGPTTVIPSFFTALGASATIIGLLSTLQRAGWLLPQLFAARYLADKPYKKPYIVVPAATSRALLMGLVALIWTTGPQAHGLVITLSTLLMAVFWIGDGLGSVAWFDFLSKSVPPHRRGRLTSVGQILAGVLSFAAGFGVEWMLSDAGPAFPTNYAGLLALAFLMLTASLTAIMMTRENKGVTAATVPSWRDYIPQLWRVLRYDHSFRRYLITRQVFGLSGLAVPFYMTYALDELHLPAQVAGRYTSIGVVGGIIAAAFFGWANERYGTRRASQVSIWLTAAIPVLALSIPRIMPEPGQLAWGYSLVFLAMQASNSCFLPAWVSYVLEWAPEAELPLYIGLTNSINGITALFSTLGGLLLQWSNGNYPLLFAVTAIGTLLALPFSIGLPEPREVVKASVLT